jgi:hypothetical protein
VDSLFPIRETVLIFIGSLWSDLADDPCRNPERQGIGGDISVYNCACADDAASSNANAGENDCASAQPAVLLDRDRQLDRD